MSTNFAYSTKYGITDLHLSQKEVAEKLGVSQQYVQQVEVTALRKFRQRFMKHYPDTWKLIQNDIGRGHFGRKHCGY